MKVEGERRRGFCMSPKNTFVMLILKPSLSRHRNNGLSNKRNDWEMDNSPLFIFLFAFCLHLYYLPPSNKYICMNIKRYENDTKVGMLHVITEYFLMSLAVCFWLISMALHPHRRYQHWQAVEDAFTYPFPQYRRLCCSFFACRRHFIISRFAKMNGKNYVSFFVFRDSIAHTRTSVYFPLFIIFIPFPLPIGFSVYSIEN